MSRLAGFLRVHAVRLVTAALVLALYGAARLPQLSAAEQADLAARFAFTRHALPELPDADRRSVREVHPSLAHISAWISSVGAAVALNDLDGDGLANDACHVDPRFDRVILSSVPGTGPRFQPFALDAAPLPYEPATMAPMGCLPGDLNEDGLMDVLVYYWGRTPVAFLRRDQDPAAGPVPLAPELFAPRDVVAGGERWYTNAATLADLDGDGHLDVIIGNYFQDGARILDARSDGREQMQHSMSRAYNGGRNRILRWLEATGGPEPAVRFAEVVGALDERVAHGWTLAVGTADLDGDLLPELYFANDFGPDRLLHNRSRPGELRFALLAGEKALTTPNSKVLGRDSFKGMGVDFGDLNDDGLPDIYVSNIAAEYALEESHFAFVSTGELRRMRDGVAPYVDRSESLGLSRSGWAWDSRLGDFDNDGVLEALQATGFVAGTVNRWPELHELALGNDELLSDPRSWPRFRPGDDLSGDQHLRFFARAKDGRYYDLADELGLDQRQVSRGIATADVDGDGDLDFAVANQWEPSYFYRNENPAPEASLGLRLLLPSSTSAPARTVVRSGWPPHDDGTRPAIGATATVFLPYGRQAIAQVDAGSGHSGKRSPDLHIGLGDLPAGAQLRVDLRWRGGDGQVYGETLHLPPGQHTLLLGAL